MLSGLLLVAATVSGCGYEGAVFAQGFASKPETGELVYCEYHLPADGDRRTVLYYAPQGVRIGEKQIVGIERSTPEVMQRDFRHGEERKVSRGTNVLEMSYRETGEGAYENAVVPDDAVDVVDAGFDVFIRRHWRGLISGQTVTFRFALPPHGRAVTLRAQRVPCAAQWMDALCIKVDLAQPLLRLFAGALNLIYDRPGRRLRVFEGISNLLDEQGSSQRVRIEYDYPE